MFSYTGFTIVYALLLLGGFSEEEIGGESEQVRKVHVSLV